MIIIFINIMIDISQGKLVFYVSLFDNETNYDYKYIYIDLKNILISELNNSLKLQDYCIVFKQYPINFLLYYNKNFIDLQNNLLNIILTNNRNNIILNIYDQIKLYINNSLNLIEKNSNNICICVDLQPISFYSYGKLNYLSYYKLTGNLDLINKQLLNWIDILFKNEMVKKIYVNEITNIFPKSDIPISEYSDNIKLFLSYICVKKETFININDNIYDMLLMDIYNDLPYDIKQIINIETDKVINMIHKNENIDSTKFIDECNSIINKIYVDDIILSIKNELVDINTFIQKSIKSEFINDDICQLKLINQYNNILIQLLNY